MKINCWYTYATEILAYSKPCYKFIVSIFKQHTVKRLQKSVEENKFFLLLPKNVTRHIPTIFKTSIRHLYKRSLELVEEIESDEQGYTTRIHHCNFYATIQKTYVIDFSESNDREFIKYLSPLYPWTHEHVFEYLTGKDPEIPETIGKGAISIIKVFRLNSPIEIDYRQADRDSSQIKSFEYEYLTPSTFNFKEPIHDEKEFNALNNLIEFLYQKTRDK